MRKFHIESGRRLTSVTGTLGSAAREALQHKFLGETGLRREEAIDGHEVVGRIGSRADLGRLKEERAARDVLAQLEATVGSMDCDRRGNPLWDS